MIVSGIRLPYTHPYYICAHVVYMCACVCVCERERERERETTRTHKVATLGVRIPYGRYSLVGPSGSAGGWKEVNNANWKGRGYVNLVWLISLRHAIRSDIYIYIYIYICVCVYVLRAAIWIIFGRRNVLLNPSPSSLSFFRPLRYFLSPNSANSSCYFKK